jgi:hypothetical protein
MAQHEDDYADEMEEDGGGHGDGMPEQAIVTPMAEEEIKDIEGSLGRIHMVLAWLLVLFGPGADEAGVNPEGCDVSAKSFRRIEGQSRRIEGQSRLRFQCMYCCLTKFLRSFNEDGTMSFEIDVSKNLGRPFTFSNPVSLKITKNMEASDGQACGHHNGCLMHRLFKTVIGGVNSLSREDLESLRSEVTLPDKTKIPKIERVRGSSSQFTRTPPRVARRCVFL